MHLPLQQGCRFAKAIDQRIRVADEMIDSSCGEY
jgi:hypothetical protein